ncbi:MAG: hypothetical protein KJI69_03855 [Patescibacteria group bacterium]|nr:hypothetical protein [Patescibacteria group bacterium]
MERATVKVVPTFRDYLKHIVSDPDFPIKSVHQLITLTSIKWIENFKLAKPLEKKLMIEELKIIQSDAEGKNFLHNSREMRDEDVK